MNSKFKELVTYMPLACPMDIKEVFFMLSKVDKADYGIYKDSIGKINSKLPTLRNQVKVFSLCILAICYKAIGNTFMFEDCVDDINTVTLHRSIEERIADGLLKATLFMNPIGISIYLLSGSPARKCRERELDEYKRHIQDLINKVLSTK